MKRIQGRTKKDKLKMKNSEFDIYSGTLDRLLFAFSRGCRSRDELVGLICKSAVDAVGDIAPCVPVTI